MEMKAYIERFLAQKKMTKTALATALGYKSKTSLVRIMDGRVRAKSVRDFERRMLETFSLSAQQEKELHDAVTIAIHGRDALSANQDMWDFIHGVGNGYSLPIGEESVWIRSRNRDERQGLLDHWREVRDLRITLINCRFDRIYTAMAKLLRSRDDVQIKHYIRSVRDNRQTIRLINGLMPVLYEERYEGYIHMIDPTEMQNEPMGIAAADVIICQYRAPDGEIREELITFYEPDVGVELCVAETASDLTLLGIREESYSPIKRTYFGKTALSDYVQYSKDYAALERGRAIWKIKPDIGVDYIPGDIIVAAVREGPLPPEWDLGPILGTLERIYTRRYQNSFSKRCPAHTIFKKSAMMQFAQTGKTSDHFWGMRAYTPEERLRILNELLRQELRNPYVHIYFCKDDDVVRDVEIACYGNLGILILPSDTDYNLAAGHSEVLITYPEMMRLFRNFFMEELVSNYTLPENDSVAILRELIAVCESQRECGE